MEVRGSSPIIEVTILNKQWLPWLPCDVIENFTYITSLDFYESQMLSRFEQSVKISCSSAFIVLYQKVLYFHN